MSFPRICAKRWVESALMEKFSLLLGYFDKQIQIIEKLQKELIHVNLHIYDKQFLFALRTQQFYTALEDLFKQIAKSFENHIENLGNFHKEILLRMHLEIPKIRPAVISKQSLYTNNLKSWFLSRVKAPNFNDRKCLCISNTKALTIVEIRQLSRA